MPYDPFLVTPALSQVVDRISNTPPFPIKLNYSNVSTTQGKLTFVSVTDYNRFWQYMTPIVLENGSYNTSTAKGELIRGRRCPVIINQPAVNPLFPSYPNVISEIISCGMYSFMLEVFAWSEQSPTPWSYNFNITEITTPYNGITLPKCYMTVFLPKNTNGTSTGTSTERS